MKYILGTKSHMTQDFSETGAHIPITIINAGPCFVTQIKTKEMDGYSAIQIGFGAAKEHRLTKPVRGHLKKSGVLVKKLIEWRVPDAADIKIGDAISAGIFAPGDKVSVTGISKGKGFQGVVKRHRFSGSPATHGHKDQLRMPGSIGATDPQRTLKGRRMGGHMGHEKVTVKNLKVVKVDAENGKLFLRGAVPGTRGTVVKITSFTDENVK
jgi:large subunit ribosomal protein L3